MKEKFPNESKNKWTRIFKKKWFFPALYVTMAAFLLTGVVWYQSTESKLIESLDEQEQTDSYKPNLFDEEAESVLQQEEIIKMLVRDEVQSEIVTKFYDYEAKQDEQEQGLTLYNNRYYQSTGVDIASSDGESFDVVASLSGTVTEVKEDPLLGNVIVMSHSDDISTYYASLGEVEVETGAKVKQGDLIGTAGKNLFSEESGTHVHFEIRKGETEVNPESFFNESLTELVQFEVEDKVEEKVEEPTAEDNEELDSDDVDLDEEDPVKDEDDETEDRDNLSFSITA